MKGSGILHQGGVLFLLVVSLLSFPFVSGCFWKNRTPKTEPAAHDLYQRGVSLAREKQFEKAREIFNKVKVIAKETDLALLAQISVADSYFEEKEYEAARTQYQEIFKLHSGGRFADYLQYRIGECYFWRIDSVDRDTSNAREALAVFKRLVRDFPRSEFVPPAKLRIRRIQGFLAENEFFIGRFYLRKKAYFAAINRFRKALTLYPGSGIDDKLVFYLYKTYRLLKDEDHAEEYRRILVNQYPNSEFIPLVSGRQGGQDAAIEDFFKGERDEGPSDILAGAPVSPVPGVDQLLSRSERHDPATASGQRKGEIGLAGTYQGRDKNSLWRRLLLLGQKEPERTCPEGLPPLSADTGARLRDRSLMEKIIPW